MATHLTITAKAPSGASTTRAFNAQAEETDAGALGDFAALLDGTLPNAETKAEVKSTLDSALGKLADLLLGDAQSGTADSEPQDPEALAAAIDATLPVVAQLDPKALFADLVNDLATLKQSLAGGEAADPELLKRIDSALNDLAATLDIDLAALGMPSLADLASLAEAKGDGDLDTAERLTKGLASLAQTLLGGAAGSIEKGGDGDAAQLLQSIADKLAKFAQALKTDAISTSELAALNLQAGGAVDAELEAALTKLLAMPAAPAEATTGPTLAKPSLSLTETALLTKPADLPASSTPLADTAKAGRETAPVLDAGGASPDSGKDAEPRAHAERGADNDNKPADARANATIAASVTEIRDNSQGAGQPAIPVARAEAAAPRIVQAGYQTSQQQLNLPQLAFELVRQVNDGNTRFQMRLDPPELGRIDVKLDIDTAGQVNARLVVEKSETLDLMQRDQKALERALQQAGLDAGKTNLEFSLRQSPFSGGQQQARDQQGQAFGRNGAQLGEAEEAPPTINLYRASLTASGVNIIA